NEVFDAWWSSTITSPPASAVADTRSASFPSRSGQSQSHTTSASGTRGTSSGRTTRPSGSNPRRERGSSAGSPKETRAEHPRRRNPIANANALPSASASGLTWPSTATSVAVDSRRAAAATSAVKRSRSASSPDGPSTGVTSKTGLGHLNHQPQPTGSGSGGQALCGPPRNSDPSSSSASDESEAGSWSPSSGTR